MSATRASRADRPSRADRSLIRARVVLLDSDPEIWRLIEIDGGLSLDRVHAALQIVMGWQDTHLHTFLDFDPFDWTPGGRRWAPPAPGEDDEDHDDLLPEHEWTLGDVLTEASPLFYEYDLGDGWLHRLDVFEILSKSFGAPAVAVIRGERRCPLEDSGGITGYEELLGVIADPAHEDHREMTDWVAEVLGDRAKPFDPAEYDEAAVNARLRRRFR